jgi:hypothetical protein
VSRLESGNTDRHQTQEILSMRVMLGIAITLAIAASFYIAACIRVAT